MNSPATPANRTAGACVQRSRLHIRSNRSRDTYRTGRHHAYARAGLGRYAPEKPWLVLLLHLSREYRCLPHLSTNSMHGGESTRCSIVLFEVQAPYRQPAAAVQRWPSSPVATALPGQRQLSARGSVAASSQPQRRSKLSSGPDARTTIPPLQWPNLAAWRLHRASDRLLCSISRGSGGGAPWTAVYS